MGAQEIIVVLVVVGDGLFVGVVVVVDTKFVAVIVARVRGEAGPY
jgi:hypothetical protein